MSLIRCPECGKMVSDMTDKCTDCGYPIYMEKKQKKKCPFCGSINYGYDSFCRNCGGQLEQEKEILEEKFIYENMNNEQKEEIKQKEINKSISLLLCIFFGYFGAHKFYEGKTGIGILYLFTIGVFGFGWILDIITIAMKPNPYYV